MSGVPLVVPRITQNCQYHLEVYLRYLIQLPATWGHSTGNYRGPYRKIARCKQGSFQEPFCQEEEEDSDSDDGQEHDEALRCVSEL